eukprot:scaffold25972_cov32-Tisochrysis_lutea.AAC.8
MQRPCTIGFRSIYMLEGSRALRREQSVGENPGHMPQTAQPSRAAGEDGAEHTPIVNELSYVALHHAGVASRVLLKLVCFRSRKLATARCEHQALCSTAGEPLTREQTEPAGAAKEQVAFSKVRVCFRRGGEALQARHLRQ